MVDSGTHGILLLCSDSFLTVFHFRSGTAGTYMVPEQFTLSEVTEHLTRWFCVMMYLMCCEESHPKLFCSGLDLSNPSI